MDHNKVLEFSAVFRGYHYYKSLRNPIPNNAIKVCDDVKIVGHLAM